MEKKPRPLQKIINIFFVEGTTAQFSNPSNRIVVCWWLIGKDSSYNLHRTEGPAYVSTPIDHGGDQKIYNYNYIKGQQV